MRLADIRVDLVGAAQDVDLDVEVELAHSAKDGLTGFLVGGDAEGRVLGGELRERDAELLLVGLGLRLDGDLDDGLGELHLLEDHGLDRVAEGVARAGILEAGERDDVAREGFLDVFAVVRVHQEHAADALLLVAARVEHVGARSILPE